MKRLVAFIAFALMLAGCDLRPRDTYRYRVTVEVDTPQGLRTGSSVWETSAVQGSGIPDKARRTTNRGEAIAVDLPGGTLFALRRDEEIGVNYPGYVVGRHLRDYPDPRYPMTPDWRTDMAMIRTKKPSFDLAPSEIPVLIRFRDINDPASVEIVQPFDLAEAFGPGVTLRRINITVTEDGITHGIKERIPWLPSVSHERGTLIPNPPQLLKDFTPVQRITPSDLILDVKR